MDKSLKTTAVRQERSDGIALVNRKWKDLYFTMIGKRYLTTLVFLLVGFLSFRSVDTDRTPPRFCSMGEEWKRVSGEKFISSFQNLDTLLEHELYLLLDKEEQPLMFYADIITPVCIDGICKPVYIELYWNLVGNYAGYGVYRDWPLTKFDHEEFVEEDYLKLHQLLSDNKSVLRRKKLSELFDENAAPAKKIEYKGEEVDAVSGATLKEIKESIIEGALYSCYTLWHLIHGEVRQKIENHLQSIYYPDLEHYFLYSGYEDYQLYALKQMEAADFEQDLPRVATIFKEAKPLIRTYLLKKLPIAAWKQEAMSQQLYRAFSQVDVNSKTLLINNLTNAHPTAQELLSGQVEEMSRNQLKTYLSFLADDESRITSAIRGNLHRAASSREYAYGYLIDEFFN